MKKKKLQVLLHNLEAILHKIESESLHIQDLSLIEEKYPSALNLIDYLTFRHFDLAQIQENLRELGLTRFARAEGHIRHSIKLNLKTLRLLLGSSGKKYGKEGISIKKSKKTLNKNTQKLIRQKAKRKARPNHGYHAYRCRNGP